MAFDRMRRRPNKVAQKLIKMERSQFHKNFASKP